MVSNASAQLFPDNTLSSFTNFLPEQLNLEGQREVAISKITLPINVPKCYGAKNYVFRQEILKVIRILLLGTWSFSSITDIVEASIILIQERHNHSENCIKVKVTRRT